MKKLLSISLSIAALFALFSCAKEIGDTNLEKHGKTVNIRFNAKNAGETKTGVTYDADGRKHTPYWNKGDKISVFFDSFTGKDKADATLANVNETGSEASFSAENVRALKKTSN